MVRVLIFALLLLTACRPAPAPPWTWARVEAGLPRQAIVQTVLINPHRPNQLWAGYYAPGGFIASADGGQTWRAAPPGLANNPVFDLLVDPVTPATLYAATRDGLFASPDNGQTWQNIHHNMPPAGVFALSAAAGTLYAGLDDAGVYARPAGQSQWRNITQTDTGLSDAAVLSLAVSANGRQLYAGTAGRGLFASRDSGLTWSRSHPTAYAPDLALHPARPDFAVAGLRNSLARTTDGGQTWAAVSGPWEPAEITALFWPQPDLLAMGTGRGQVFYSNDGSLTWRKTAADLPAGSAVLSLARDSRGRLLAGAWTGLFASPDNGQSWVNLAPEIGAPQANALLPAPAGLLLGTHIGLFRWDPAQTRWLPAAQSLAGVGIASLAAAQTEPRLIYAGSTGQGVFRSQDGGHTWQAMPSLSTGVPGLAVDPANPHRVLMLAAWERVYDSHDGGQTWQARWAGLGPDVEALSVAVDPRQSTVHLGVDNGLYRARGNGPWLWQVPYLLDQSVLALRVQPLPEILGGGSILYVGTTRGAFRSLDQGQTLQGPEGAAGWGRGLENVSVTAFLAYPRHPARLMAGTAYAGVYQSLDWGFTWQAIGPAEANTEVIKSLAWGPGEELFVAAAGGVWRGQPEGE